MRAHYSLRPSLVSPAGTRHFIDPEIDPYRAMCGQVALPAARFVPADRWSGARRQCQTCCTVEIRRMTKAVGQ